MCKPLNHAQERARLTAQQIAEERERTQRNRDRRAARRHKARNRFAAITPTQEELD